MGCWKRLTINKLQKQPLSPPNHEVRRICNDRGPMPSTVGHALAGVAAAWAVDAVPGRRAWRAAPPHASWFRKAGGGLTLLCAAIAAAPDLDLLFHLHRTYSHSIGAVLLAALVAAAIAASRHRPAVRVAAMCG